MGKGSSATKSQGNVTAFTPVEGPSAWYAADFKDDDTWIYQLTDSDIQEIEAAIDAVKASKKDIKVSFAQTFESGSQKCREHTCEEARTGPLKITELFRAEIAVVRNGQMAKWRTCVH